MSTYLSKEKIHLFLIKKPIKISQTSNLSSIFHTAYNLLRLKSYVSVILVENETPFFLPKPYIWIWECSFSKKVVAKPVKWVLTF